MTSSADRSGKHKLAATRILLADDSQMVRGMLKAVLLQQNHSWEISEAENGQQALDKVLALRPQVAMLDLNLPDMSGEDAARQVRQLSPATKIILCSLSESAHLAVLAEHLGADGYFSKTSSPEELHRTIVGVLSSPGPDGQRF
jgi:DNA-binding NarL/FixJ family response regulator